METHKDFIAQRFLALRHPDQDAAEPIRRPVVVAGAGPVGLALAIDLAQRGVPVVLIDKDDRFSDGSRAICFAKRTLEIFDRLGCGHRMMEKGVSWQVGKVFFREQQVYQFDLQEEEGHARPAFINLPQYFVEGYLSERASELEAIDLRWQQEVTAFEPHEDHVVLTVSTPHGPYRLAADHVIACDGSRSTLRDLVGETSHGRRFRDRFLIADVRMKVDRPAERWFWFDPSFHPNQSVLLHMQPDGLWRIDFQLGWDADPEFEKRPENIIPRVKALLGEDTPFEIVWASVYTFACTRMPHFRVGRVIFAGDSAHGVSPFGARGANSGVQDADNLAWKLALVLQGRAPESLLDSYAAEREYAADENILNSTRATDFISPKSEISLLFRNAVLDLSRQHAFARTLVNSGRLSVPAVLRTSPLNTPDSTHFDGGPVPGACAIDAPVKRQGDTSSWLLHELSDGFTLLAYGNADSGRITLPLEKAGEGRVPLKVLHVLACEAATHAEGPDALLDHEGLVAERYDMLPGTVYLLRPDQHVCARWRQASVAAVHAALSRALGQPMEASPR